jgi:hypothetical protein
MTEVTFTKMFHALIDEQRHRPPMYRPSRMEVSPEFYQGCFDLLEKAVGRDRICAGETGGLRFADIEVIPINELSGEEIRFI